VLDRCGAGAVLALDEAERRVRVPLGELADDMTAAGVPATPDGIAAALASWVAHRPVPDRVAAAEGVAVLDWADAGRRGLAWRVVVRRDDVAVAWTPSPRPDAAAVARTRAAAGERAARLPVSLRVEGPIALWSHPVPLLASAVLAAPGRVAAELAATGLRPDGAHAVVTPHRPVACAAPAVAARLAGETPEDCVTLPCAALAGLPWG
jgi:hypothetical protein